MVISLTDIEARILGSLIEKSHITPDQYPLSLNALKNACNQKTSRDPVMDLDETTIARALSTLQENELVGRRMDPGSRVTKFVHHVEHLTSGPPQHVGVLCMLMLRGPQTTGELKIRTDRLCEFSSVAEVEGTLQELMSLKDGAMVERLERQSGQKEARYRQLFTSGASSSPPVKAPTPKPQPVVPDDRITRLEKRVEALEQSLRELKP